MTPWQDPIVAEIHAVRAQLLAHFGGDLHKYSEFLRTQTPERVAAEVALATTPRTNTDATPGATPVQPQGLPANSAVH